MKKSGILNPELIAAIARIGHTEYLAVADAGLPIPNHVETIDLSLVRGIPDYNAVLKAISGELVIESYIIAEEMAEKSSALLTATQDLLGALPQKRVSHEAFKKLLPQVKMVIRTGETTPYANIILVAGVNF